MGVSEEGEDNGEEEGTHDAGRLLGVDLERGEVLRREDVLVRILAVGARAARLGEVELVAGGRRLLREGLRKTSQPSFPREEHDDDAHLLWVELLHRQRYDLLNDRRKPVRPRLLLRLRSHPKHNFFWRRQRRRRRRRLLLPLLAAKVPTPVRLLRRRVPLVPHHELLGLEDAFEFDVLEVESPELERKLRIRFEKVDLVREAFGFERLESRRVACGGRESVEALKEEVTKERLTSIVSTSSEN